MGSHAHSHQGKYHCRKPVKCGWSGTKPESEQVTDTSKGYSEITWNNICPECGAVFEGKEREIHEADGELVEVDRKAQQGLRRRQQGQAQGLEALVDLAKKRGYKSPYGWARHVLDARGG